MITKHNDFDQIERLKALSADALRNEIVGGLIQLGSFDTEKVCKEQDITLSPDFYIGFSHPADLRNKGFKVDWTKFRNPPRSHARIFSKSKEGSFALRDGMVKFAENVGLSPDHAFNWSRSFDMSRFALIHCLVEVQNNEELRQYIKTVPIIGSFQQFKNWLLGAPTDNPDIGMLDQRGITNLSGLAEKLLRPRFTQKETFEMRQDYLEAKALRSGQPFERAVYVEREPREFKPRNDRQPRQHTNRNTDRKPATDNKFDNFRKSVEGSVQQDRRPVQEERAPRPERHTTIMSCMPNHEERNRRKKSHKKSNNQHQSRKESRWQ